MEESIKSLEQDRSSLISKFMTEEAKGNALNAEVDRLKASLDSTQKDILAKEQQWKEQSLEQQLKNNRLQTELLSLEGTVDQLDRAMKEIAMLKEKQANANIQFDDSDVIALFLREYGDIVTKQQERWGKTEAAVSKASSALLRLQDRVPKYQESINKILLLLQKVQQSGRKNIVNLENHLNEKRDQIK